MPILRPDSPPPTWSVLLAEQHGVVSHHQLRTHGFTVARIAAEVRARRWQQVLPRVYATFTGPLPPEALVVAALLYGGPSALLSHRTAAERWGLLPSGPTLPVEITVPYGRSAVSQLPFVLLHRSRAHRHLVAATAPPMTSRADTAIDVAVAEPDARAARQLLTAVLATGRVSPNDVRRRLLERPPLRYRNALDEAVRMVSGGVQSVLEERYAVDVEQAHGLPNGRRQQPVVYDGAGARLTVRLDGRTHLQADVALKDRRRGNAAELAGRARLVFGWTEVATAPCVVAAEVTTVLLRSGAHLAANTCSRCSGGVVSA